MYDNIIKMALEKGFNDFQVLAVRKTSQNITVYQNKLDKLVKSKVEIFQLKGIYQDKLAEATVENISLDNLEQAIQKMIENAQSLTVCEPSIIFEGSKKYHKIKDKNYDFSKVSQKKKIQLVLDLEMATSKGSNVKQVQNASYAEIESTTTLTNSKGLSLSKSSTYAYLVVQALFERQKESHAEYEIKIVTDFNDFNYQELSKSIIDKGNASLGGLTIESGKYPVVFSNEMFSDVLSVFEAAYTGSSAHRKLTSLLDKVGQEIATKEFNLIDDPFLPEAYEKPPFDDEGVACEKRYLVKKGIFQGFIHNLKTAKIFNQEPTGNGFNGGVSVTNAYLEPTDLSFTDMIKPIRKGVYVTALSGLHAGVQAISGEFSLQASGFLIEDGVITAPVKMIVISGNFYQMIKKIDGIANDFKFNSNGYGSPSVHINELTIGGK